MKVVGQLDGKPWYIRIPRCKFLMSLLCALLCAPCCLLLPCLPAWPGPVALLPVPAPCPGVPCAYPAAACVCVLCAVPCRVLLPVFCAGPDDCDATPPLCCCALLLPPAVCCGLCCVPAAMAVAWLGAAACALWPVPYLPAACAVLLLCALNLRC